MHIAQWQPEITVPKIVVRSFAEAGLADGNGLALSHWLIENSHEISLPTSEPSVLVDDSDRTAEPYKSRYTGPNIFNLPGQSDEITALHAVYKGYMLKVWQEEFNVQVEPHDLNARAAEAFTTNPKEGEINDPHVDTQYVCAGYSAPGAALVVSHCTNGHNITDIEREDATLVLPGAQSLVFFRGNIHPHVGVSPNIDMSDNANVQQAKLQSLIDRFNIVELALPGSEPRPDESDSPKNLDSATISNLLARWPELGGDRIVMSFNFREPGSPPSSLDEIFV